MTTTTNTAAESSVNLSNVEISLGSGSSRVRILRSLSLNASAGETVALLGPSGSGKSTLLMILSGLERPDSGTVSIGGQEITKLNENELASFRSENIGIIFQNFNLIPTMTAQENVAAPLNIRNEPDAMERSAAELTVMGLGERLKHYPVQLSGGEQQRVAIARAMVIRPKLLLADEPTGNLDDDTSNSVADTLFARQKENNSTIILVTHDSELAKRCSRQYNLSAGTLLGS